MLDHGLRALANVTLQRHPERHPPWSWHCYAPAENCHRRAACSLRVWAGMREPSPISASGAPELPQAVSGLPPPPRILSPSRTRLRGLPPANCVTPIHHAEHDCKGVPCRRRSATETPGMRPFCRPMAIILSFLHLLSRHTTHVAGVRSRSTYADRPDIQSGSASDSNALVGFTSPVQVLHTRAPSMRTSP